MNLMITSGTNHAAIWAAVRGMCKNGYEDHVEEVADCFITEDCSGFDGFDGGFDLGVKASEQLLPIYQVTAFEVTYFFLGEAVDILEKLEKIKEEG